MKVFVDASMKPPVTCLAANKDSYIIESHKETTHNQAEYEAIIRAAMKWLEEELVIYSDSELAISQINSALGQGKKYKCNDVKLRKKLEAVLALVVSRGVRGLSTKYVWVPREENVAGIILEGK